MEVKGIPCSVCALEEGQIMELRLEQVGQKSILGNIYTAQVENIAQNIQAAFVLIAPGVRCYFSLGEADQVIYSAGRKGKGPLRPGDEILVQVNRDAMKETSGSNGKPEFHGEISGSYNRRQKIRAFP